MRLLFPHNDKERRKELEKIGVSKEALDILLKKWRFLSLKIEGLTPGEANILKQLALEIGADVATHRNAITGKKEKVDVLFLGTERELEKLLLRLDSQPFNLKSLSKKVKNFLSQKALIWRIKEKEIDLSKKFLIMGVLNITPDSFYDGGKYLDKERAIKRAEEFIEEGVDIIDIGAESTRPGAEPVPMEEELKRVLPVLKEIRRRFDGFLSVDTYKPQVAKEVAEEGADIINDTSGAKNLKGMADIIKRYKTGYVLMHIKGTPKTMQKNPSYEDVVEEVYRFFGKGLSEFELQGVSKENIIIDPGIGFGKTLEHNLILIKRVKEFLSLHRPILVGPSRKSFIGMITGKPPEERLFGTVGTCAFLFSQGVSVFRVHDVKEIKEALAVVKEVRDV